MGPRKGKNTGGKKGNEGRAPTNKGLANAQVIPSQVCRHKVARVAGGSRVRCSSRDRRRAAAAIKSHGDKKTFIGWGKYMCSRISRLMDHAPPLEGKWCHDSAYECHLKSPQKMAKQSDKQPGQQPDNCTVPYRIGYLCRHRVSSVVLGLIVFSYLI